MAQDTWTEERIARLKGCIERKLSGSQTAAELGLPKNAVVGKAHRLGWKFLSTPGHAKKNRKRIPVASFIFRPKAPPIERPPEPEPYAGFLSVPFGDINLDTQCLFIEGPSKGALYCGQPASDGPWCDHHKKLCYHTVTISMRGHFKISTN